MLELANKNFKLAVIAMFNGIKENMFAISEKIKKHVNYEKNQIKILGLQYTISETKVKTKK